MESEPTCSRLGECEVCGISAKYSCPRCELKTCSVACINIHKREFKCDGKRDKVKFIRLKEFKDLDLENDYRLLEEISRTVDTFGRDPLLHSLRRNSSLPLHMMRLQTEAAKRGLSLLFLPQEFSRHKCNTTYLKWKTNEFFWRIDWIFPQANNTILSDDRIIDSTRLSLIINKYLNTEYSQSASALQYYCSAGLSGVKLLLKAELEPGSRYFELDLFQTLRENLEGKAIIEFPIIYIILRDHKDEYDVITPDEEEEIRNRHRHARSRKRILSRGNDFQNSKELKSETKNKNFLISNGDESDEDDCREENVIMKNT